MEAAFFFCCVNLVAPNEKISYSLLPGTGFVFVQEN